MENNTEDISEATSSTEKSKIGAFLSKKGVAIGTSVGISLVAIGGALEETTNWFSALFQIIKTWIF